MQKTIGGIRGVAVLYSLRGCKFFFELADRFLKENDRIFNDSELDDEDLPKTVEEKNLIETFDWFLHVRDLQKWYVPNISEEDVLQKPMAEIMVNLLQMKMEVKAAKARNKHDKRIADQKSKNKK